MDNQVLGTDRLFKGGDRENLPRMGNTSDNNIKKWRRMNNRSTNNRNKIKQSHNVYSYIFIKSFWNLKVK